MPDRFGTKWNETSPCRTNAQGRRRVPLSFMWLCRQAWGDFFFFLSFFLSNWNETCCQCWLCYAMLCCASPTIASFVLSSSSSSSKFYFYDRRGQEDSAFSSFLFVRADRRESLTPRDSYVLSFFNRLFLAWLGLAWREPLVMEATKTMMMMMMMLESLVRLFRRRPVCLLALPQVIHSLVIYLPFLPCPIVYESNTHSKKKSLFSLFYLPLSPSLFIFDLFE